MSGSGFRLGGIVRHTTLRLIAVLGLTLLVPTLGLADVIWGAVSSTLPSPPPGELAVLFTSGILGNYIGNSTYLITGSTIDGTTVHITTNNNNSSGVDHLYAIATNELRANQYPEPPDPSYDTSLDELTISLSESTFGDTYMSLSGAFAGTTTALFTVVTNAGTFTHRYDGLGSGNNWVFIRTTSGDTMQSVSLESRFWALKDLHLSEIDQVEIVPEPASLALFGSGLLWVAYKRRK